MRRIVGLFRYNSGALASKKGTYATLTLSAPGNSPEEQLQALDAAISEAQFTDMNKRFKACSGQPGYDGLLGVDEILRRQVLLDAEHTLRRLPDLGSVLPQ